MVQPYYQVIKPTITGTFEVEWDACKRNLEQILDQDDFRIFRLNVFIYAEDDVDFIKKRDKITESVSGSKLLEYLPLSILPQRPEPPYQVIIESGMIPGDESIQYKSLEGFNIALLKDNEAEVCWISGLGRTDTDNFDQAVNQSFHSLVNITVHEGFTLNEIIRQWNYVGDILGMEGNNEQHYQVFNNARSRFYAEFRNLCYFPAATGIGMNFRGLFLDCLLIKGGKTIEIIPVSNPMQTDSYAYGKDVLVGKGEKVAPQFERGILYRSGKDYRFFISGTASILGQNSIGLESAESQTINTLKNIEILASEENLRKHCPGLLTGNRRYGYIRVYVKHLEDIPKIKAICYNHFGDIPITYVQADICRDNLLVEIEGEIISESI